MNLFSKERLAAEIEDDVIAGREQISSEELISSYFSLDNEGPSSALLSVEMVQEWIRNLFYYDRSINIASVIEQKITFLNKKLKDTSFRISKTLW